jgi:hypothetical protein
MEIVLDFDGTVVTHNYPFIGSDIGSVPVLRKIIENNHKLILFTMRSGKTLDDAIKWFKINEIPLYGVQKNPTQDKWTSSPKAYGQLIIDDAALGCPLIYNPVLSDRPFVDWSVVEKKLKEMGVLSE